MGTKIKTAAKTATTAANAAPVKKHRCTKACKFHAPMKAKLARRAAREQQRLAGLARIGKLAA